METKEIVEVLKEFANNLRSSYVVKDIEFGFDVFLSDEQKVKVEYIDSSKGQNLFFHIYNRRGDGFFPATELTKIPCDKRFAFESFIIDSVKKGLLECGVAA